MKHYFFFIISLLLSTNSIAQREIFFYGVPDNTSEKVNLLIMPNEYLIQLKPEVEENSINLIKGLKENLGLINQEKRVYKILISDENIKNDQNGILLNKNFNFITPVLKPTQESKDFYLTDEFIAWFKPSITFEEIKTINSKNDVEIVKKLLVSNEYVLRVKKTNGLKTLEIANIYHTSGITHYAIPNFLLKPDLFADATDPYYQYQYYLNSTVHNIAIEGAWQLTKGNENIIIAILDDGLELTQQDIPSSKFIYTKDWADNDNNVNPPTNENRIPHGTAVTGIIAATHDNDIGIKGIAPNCNFIFLKIVKNDGQFMPSENLHQPIDDAWLQGASVLSNSWGFENAGPNFTLTNIVAAINRARTMGRGDDDMVAEPGIDKGCVVVFAVGNNGSYASFPSTVSGVIGVGAIGKMVYKQIIVQMIRILI